MCRFVAMVVSDNPSFGAGGSHSQTFCEEHGMSIPGPATVEGLCPIGRIEAARDQALKAIAEAQRIHWVDAVSTKDYRIKS